MHIHDYMFRYMITIISQNEPFYHQAEIQSGEDCVLTKEDMLPIFSNLAIMVLDASFTNPFKTAGFLFFDNEDGKKNDNNVVNVKGCLIHAHVDMPPSPAGQ